jgi:glucans biosynthesis protein
MSLLLALAGSAGLALLQDDPSWQALRQRAKELSDRAYVERKSDDLPEWLKKIDYDGYRRLRFRPECLLWSSERLPFSVQFHHRGYLFPEKVPMWQIDPFGGDSGPVRSELQFDPAQFDYASFKQTAPVGLGYSGFAVRARAGDPGIGAEFAAFQGASYFRLAVRGQPYGASARGLAIDTASDRGEEFPAFVEMGLQKPAEGAKELVVYALLDSPSASGAFRFAIAPEEQTRAEVLAAVFPRKKIEKLGLAPLTSMFLLGEDRMRPIQDWRPEIHDSDGLLVHVGDGSWLWRPLQNPPRTHQVQRFALEDPKGFGLLQRDRAFASYQDLEARYDKRPSFWVTPRQGWGKGVVELVEIPTSGERNENIVAYWVPERPVAKGDEIEFAYELSASTEEPARPLLARVRSVRVGPLQKAHLFVVDFDARRPEPPKDGPPNDGPPKEIRADLATTEGRIQNLVLQANEAEGGQRCSFELTDDDAEALEIRLTLRIDGEAVSETLVFPWPKR